MTSEVIPARFVVEDRVLRVLDTRTVTPIPWFSEAVQALKDDEAALKAAEALRQQAEAARRQAEEARRRVEEENARLRAEIERLRGERREPGA